MCLQGKRGPCSSCCNSKLPTGQSQSGMRTHYSATAGTNSQRVVAVEAKGETAVSSVSGNPCRNCPARRCKAFGKRSSIIRNISLFADSKLCLFRLDRAPLQPLTSCRAKIASKDTLAAGVSKPLISSIHTFSCACDCMCLSAYHLISRTCIRQGAASNTQSFRAATKIAGRALNSGNIMPG